MIKSFRDKETEGISPVHPGEILLEEFLKPLGVTQKRLTLETRVPLRRVYDIGKGLRGIDAETALRFSRYFGTSERFWLNLQVHFDVEVEKERLGNRLIREVEVLANP